jgi:hypothetical protein
MEQNHLPVGSISDVMTTHLESLVLIAPYFFNDVMNGAQLNQNCGERLKKIIKIERMIIQKIWSVKLRANSFGSREVPELLRCESLKRCSRV